MGQILHGSATTTAATRREIQNSEESIKTLAKRYNINPKTVVKWKQRNNVEDKSRVPEKTRSTVLSEEEEAMCVAFRKHSLLPLDDCLYSLQEQIPHLRRTALHRVFQRNGISRLPKNSENNKGKKKKKFKDYNIGYFHIDITELSTKEGKLYLFVAIDRVTKFAYAKLFKKHGKMQAAEFLEGLIKAVPYKIHTILTDNGIQFTDRNNKHSPVHIFERTCLDNHIEHRLTKLRHPWTNGQVERINRTIKDATVKHYHYDYHEQLDNHLHAFLDAYNFAKRLKTLRGLTPYQSILNWWQHNNDFFFSNPYYLTSGPYN